LSGNDVAMLWLGQAICSGCFKKVRTEHPEVTQFGLIPLVDLRWMGFSGAGADLMLDVTPIGANEHEDVDGVSGSLDGHIH
jgi:hypothetical protein